MIKNLKFKSMEEWFAALPKLNRSEICLLNDDQKRGMEVFEADQSFKDGWHFHYFNPISSLAEFKRITRRGWYPMLAPIAVYWGDDSVWRYREPNNPDSDFWRSQVEERLHTPEGQEVVLARVDRIWPHHPFCIFDATSIPTGGELYIEFELGWWLREHGTPFRVCLGHAPDELWVMRAMQYLQTEGTMGEPTRAARLHELNAGAILDWIFIKDERYHGGNVPVLSEVSAFLDDHPNKRTFKDLKRIVRLAELCSNIWYFNSRAK